MQSFNAFGGSAKKFGGHMPVWLGTVSPRAKGARLADAYVKANVLYPAGTPVCVENVNGQPVATPLAVWKVVSVDASAHAITVIPAAKGLAPSVNDILCPVGATFATAGAAGKVSAVAKGEGEAIVITFTSTQLDGVAAGTALAISGASAPATSGAVVAKAPNGYIYNDVYFDGEVRENAGATCAVVDFHGEGILIDRTPAAAFAVAMKVAVPNVIQING